MILTQKTIATIKKSITFYLPYIRCISGVNLWKEDLTSDIKHKIENHWKEKIVTSSFDNDDTTREKYYVLSMFPYPSGFLHMGHVRVYTISDTVARYQRMNGKNVIHPIGWDAFGLPAENAAIDRQIPPDEWTTHNISHMKKQLQQLGCSFEWEREIATCDPQYYKWTQHIFLMLYEAGLVYRKEALVNWDPVDKTVLADEQVDENGLSWRSGAKIEKKLLKQWFVRTTKFAKDLLEGLDDSMLQDWKDVIKLQRHWLGDVDGVNFHFKTVNSENEEITLWTSKPEFIEHVKFVIVSNSHRLAKSEGIKSNGRTVKLNVTLKNPLTNEIIPVFVSSEFELLPKTDSYVGIPGVLEEATIFANKQNIKFTFTPQPASDSEIKDIQNDICEKANKLNAGGYWSSAKLRDWLISRQRYWGTPIPIIHCEKCGPQPVPKENLPVKLPKLSKSIQRGGPAQLANVKDWFNTTCPKCQGFAQRETDTLDTFFDSSWYFLRYLDPQNTNEIFNKNNAMRMMPVDLYIGGKEHAVLHLYYARFMNHFLHSLRLVPEREPFKRLLVQGMVMGRSFRKKCSGEYLPPNNIKIVDLKKNKAITKDTGEPVVMSWEKMSKSKYNGVNPEDMFKEYGTDTTRLLILADVSPTSHRNWNSNTFPGILNWQKRLWLTIQDFLKHRTNLPQMILDDQFKAHNNYLFDSRNYYVKETSFNYLISQQLSVAVSKQQGLTNSLRKVPSAVLAHSPEFERALGAQIILLAPMAPYFASELWSGFVSAQNRLNENEFFWNKKVFEQEWPQIDKEYSLDLVCQVNGYKNCAVKIPRKTLDTLTKEDAIKIAINQKEVQSTLKTRTILNVKCDIYVGCEGIVNILTDQPPPKIKEQKLNVAEN